MNKTEKVIWEADEYTVIEYTELRKLNLTKQ